MGGAIAKLGADARAWCGFLLVGGVPRWPRRGGGLTTIVSNELGN